MSRIEADRGDLMAEATALVRRAEVVGSGNDEPVVIGFRRDGGLSIYLGPDPVYHFDAEGGLRRAFRSGRIYRTQGSTLAELTRDRSAAATVLRRRELTKSELDRFLGEMGERIGDVIERHRLGELKPTRQVPAHDTALWADFETAVRRIVEGGVGRLAPRIKGKR